MDRDTVEGLQILASELDNAAELLAAMLSHARGGERPSAALEREVARAIRAIAEFRDAVRNAFYEEAPPP